MLTSDVMGSITVERSNIIFDGGGHAIIGGPTEIGIGGLIIGSLPTAPTAGISYLSNVTVKNFRIMGSVIGISLWQTSEVTVANNSISGTGNGILALDQPTAGINVEGGGSNIIMGNNLTNNNNGMRFFQTENNLIIENSIENSLNSAGVASYGISLFAGAVKNSIYHNNFINIHQVYNALSESPSPVNNWDNGYPDGGNYWSDYLTRYVNAKMIDNSGIGNMSYVIDSQNKDRYPLMEPFNSTAYLLETTPPKISVLSPLNQTYNESSVSLVFTVDKLVNWTTYLLDGKENVTLTGNITLTGLSSGLHNITVYAKDSFENIGASEPVTFTVAKEPESFPTTVVAAASVVSVAIVGVGLFCYFRKRNR